MSATLPSPPASSLRGRDPLPAEALRELLGGLLCERERLHLSGSPAELEVNRCEIVRLQWELARELGRLHAAA